MSPPVVRPAALGPDPRILARRIAVRRDEGRRRLRRLLWAFGALVVVAAAAAATRTPLLDVDHIRVAGGTRVPASDVLEAAASAGAARGEPLTSLDAGAVERAIEALPGVAEARVARRWPGTIVVDVVDREPVAALAAPSGTAIVAGDGVVIDVASSPPAGLPVIETTADGIEPGTVVEADDLLAVAAALPASISPSVAAIAPSGDSQGEVELRLTDGGSVRLGPVADIGDKLVAVATVLEQVDLACLAVLDVRVPSAPTITRGPGCSP